ncbi:MAG: hypothetical protein KDN19_07730 [Verrucomicrobiae bacterium]|nr:hypothetical protein [Verrucomicrobiae bacterium]
MADPRAHVTSIDSLERFRASLLVFIDRAKLVIDEVNTETNRTRMWLQGDQRMFWNRELKRRNQDLDEAQAQLLSARISALGEATHAHHKAVQRAKMAVKDAEDKLRAVKQWNRHFDSRLAPLTKQLGKLDNLLNGDMEKAAHFLNQSIKNLQDYADIRQPGSLEKPPAPASTEDEMEEGS